MKYLIVILFMLSGIFSLKAQDQVLGKWVDEYNSKVVDIYKSGGRYYGKIVWLRDSLNFDGTKRRDIYNEDESKRSRLLKGVDVLMNFEWDASDDEWDNGKIYSEFSGNTYSAKMWISDGMLRIKGYYGFLFFLGRTRTWTRKR